MKKKTSNLWVFVIIIPLFAFALSFIFDSALILIENKRLVIVTKNIIEDSFAINVNDYYQKVKDDYEKQKITTEQLAVTYNDGVLFVYNKHYYQSFFGRLMDVNSYSTEISITGTLVKGQVVFEEVEYD